MSDMSLASRAAYAYAEANNLRVVLPKDNELQIDIDSDADFAQFTQAYDKLFGVDFVLPMKFDVTPSRNGGEGRHITVTLHKPIDPLTRIALQAVLGSDWKRELFGLVRLHNDDPNPTLFYETPEETPDAVRVATISE